MDENLIWNNFCHARVTIIFNNELIVGTEGIPSTRDEVRKSQGPLNVI